MAHPSPNPVYRGSPVCLDELDFPATSLRRDSPVEQLIAVVTRSLFASDCAVRHLANGAWNTVYVVTLTQPRPPYIPQTVVCRVSLAAKTDSCLSIQSEVDTMMYVLGRTRIPIPKIYAYCTNGNVLSQTYMFLEHITTGQRMREAFELLDEAGRARAIREYAGVVHRLSQLRFSRIGSLLRTPAPGRGEPEYTVAGPSMVRSNHSERAGQRTHTALERPFTAVVPWLLAMEEDELRFVRAHPERVAEWSNFFAGKSLNEVVEIVCTVLRSVIKEIPRACDTGPLSKILCLWHYDLNSGNIMISTRGADAGRIVAVIDWDGAIVTPIWRVVRWPDFISIRGGRDYRPEADKRRYQEIMRGELLRLDSDGLLRTALQERYDVSRELVEVVTQPWNATYEREQWLELWKKRREKERADKAEGGGWMSDAVGSLLRRGGKGTRRR